MKRLTLWMMAIAITLPIVLLCVYALATRYTWPGIVPQESGLRGLRALFSLAAMKTLLQSVLYSLISALFSTLVAIPAARAFAFYEFWGKRLFRSLLLLPILLPATSFFIGLQIAFTKIGVIDTAFAVIVAHSIVILPYPIWTITDVMQSIGLLEEEQARTLGASRLRAFVQTSLFKLLPCFACVVALGFVISFGQYFLTLMIGGGRVQTFAMLVVPYIQGGDRMISSAYSLLFALISVAVYGAFYLLMKKHYAFQAGFERSIP